MIISHAKRFVVFSPWKCASSTTRERLGPYNESPYEEFFYFNKVLQRVVHNHVTVADFMALPESRLGYYAAAFVRNPYDRVFSGFMQLRTDEETQPLHTFADPLVRDLVLEQLDDTRRQLQAADYDFDRWWSMVKDHQVLEVGRNTSFSLHPAIYWTHLGDRRYVDFIGRVESFESDYENLLEMIGIEETSRDNVNVRQAAPSENAAVKYLDRMSRTSIDKINALFAQDFETFGYDRM